MSENELSPSRKQIPIAHPFARIDTINCKNKDERQKKIIIWATRGIIHEIDDNFRHLKSVCKFPQKIKNDRPNGIICDDTLYMFSSDDNESHYWCINPCQDKQWVKLEGFSDYISIGNDAQGQKLLDHYLLVVSNEDIIIIDTKTKRLIKRVKAKTIFPMINPFNLYGFGLTKLSDNKFLLTVNNITIYFEVIELEYEYIEFQFKIIDEFTSKILPKCHYYFGWISLNNDYGIRLGGKLNNKNGITNIYILDIANKKWREVKTKTRLYGYHSSTFNISDNTIYFIDQGRKKCHLNVIFISEFIDFIDLDIYKNNYIYSLYVLDKITQQKRQSERELIKIKNENAELLRKINQVKSQNNNLHHSNENIRVGFSKENLRLNGWDNDKADKNNEKIIPSKDDHNFRNARKLNEIVLKESKTNLKHCDTASYICSDDPRIKKPLSSVNSSTYANEEIANQVSTFQTTYPEQFDKLEG